MLFLSLALSVAGLLRLGQAEVTGADVSEIDFTYPSQWVNTSRGAHLRVFVQGNPNDPAITIVPSAAQDSGHDFDNVTSYLLATGWLVIRPQLEGVLGSTVPDSNATSSSATANDIADVIDTLAGGRSIILGHVAGGQTARLVSYTYPDKALGLILAALSSPNAPSNVSSYVQNAMNFSLPTSARLDALQKGIFASGNNASVWLDGWYPETVTAAAKPSSANSSTSSSNGLAGANNNQILEIISAEDPFRPESTWDERTSIAPGRVTQVIIQNASHALFPEQPQKVVEAILPWSETRR